MRKKHILIVNQHGENRGDEAAMRAMIEALDRDLRNVRFSIVVQFKDRSVKIPFKQDVELLHMVMPVLDALGLVLFGLAKFLGLKLTFLLSHKTKKIIKAYEVTDLVLSAPGGPYYGDIYYRHELVHWFYIWLACLYKKPLFLYAPSAGPFNIKTMNPLRKYFFKKFDVLCVRESISKQNLQQLLGERVAVYLTADSALQAELEPYDKAKYFTGERAPLAEKYLVAVTGMQYRYPGENRVAERRAEFTKALLKCLVHVSSSRDCHFLFLPQLYGSVHSDVPYHQHLGQSLPPGTSWEIVGQECDSDTHRRLFSIADLCIASRYHPQIFATSNGVPGVYICYEHKQFGYLTALGVGDFTFDISKLDADAMCVKLDEAIERRVELSALMKKNIIPIRELSRQTTRLVAELFRKTYKEST